MRDASKETKDVEEIEGGEAEVSAKTQMDLQVAAVIPIHQVSGSNAKRPRGRPKKIQKAPTADDLAYHAMMQQAQTAYVDNDDLVTSARDKKGVAESLYILKERLARMAATLEFRRIEDEKFGGANSPQIISRQAAILKEVAGIELKLKELDAQLVDPYSEPIQKLFQLFIDKVRLVAEEALPPEHFDVLFNRLQVEFEKWEEEADGALR